MVRKNIYIILFIFASCSSVPESWTVYLNGLGTYSSPRLTDLNNDGTLDIIIGAGVKEGRHSDSSVIALDGKSGKLLWQIPGENQFVGSAVFIDMNKDGTNDIIIGGRSAELAAINGANGKILWQFTKEEQRYNFTTPQFIADLDHDNIKDILIAYGGDATKPAGDTIRPAGELLIISSATGKILSRATVPDKKETYLSVVIKDSTVLFGTGGESIGGHLYRTSLNNIIRGDISNAQILVTGTHKGFISSPVYADINRDGTPDIIINKVEGEMLVLDGKTDSIIWKLSFPGTEAYTNPAIGFFTNDSVPDIFCNYAIGVFPDLRRSIRFMADGRTGKIVYIDTIKAFQYASAVVADMNNDGHDDILINQSEGKRLQFSDKYYSYLTVLDFYNNNKYAIGDTVKATNLASTPWIGDMDNDGLLDIVHASVNYHDIKFDLEQPLGLFVGVHKLNTPAGQSIKWGAYMGSFYNNIFYD
jgi:outer membrane protein assembly factor BamB